jgi:hypothetical protein
VVLPVWLLAGPSLEASADHTPFDRPLFIAPEIVVEAGDRVHGASVHFVTRELDGGPVVLQARVPVRDDDDEARLTARVLAHEHRIYPECIGWFAAGRLAYRDGRLLLDGRELEAPLVREAHDEVAA